MTNSNVDIHSIIAGHRRKETKVKSGEGTSSDNHYDPGATLVEIPDIFFEDILIRYKLNRIEMMVLMYLYRHVWCRPNLYRIHGLSQVLSHSEMSAHMRITLDEIYHSLRKLEELGFIETIRSGQYFVRRYFTEEYDEKFGQNYDDFDI